MEEEKEEEEEEEEVDLILNVCVTYVLRFVASSFK